MIISIDSDWPLQSDEHSWSIARRKEVKSGKTKGRVEWNSIRWFPSLSTAVHGLFELQLRLSDAERIARRLHTALNGQFDGQHPRE